MALGSQTGTANVRSPHPARTGRLEAARRRGRVVTVWATTQALPRAVLRRNAARGDIASSLTVDRAVRLDPFDTYERLRGHGTGRARPAGVGQRRARGVRRGAAQPGVRGRGAETLLPKPLEWVLARCMDEDARGPVDRPSLLAVDDPAHARYRRLVSRNFTARAVAAHTARIEQTAADLLDALHGADTFDLVDRYAALLPVTVIADVLGVPGDMREQFLDWGNAAALTLDPGLSWAQFRRADTALREMHAWLDEHLERLRGDPGDDLVSSLVKLQGADALSPLEMRALALLLLGAGFETTVNLIGNAVAQLFDHPEQRALVTPTTRSGRTWWRRRCATTRRCNSPPGWRTTRWTSPALRWAPGSVLMTLVGGANRDPAVFADPQRFDITRANAGAHLAFSAGAHYCLGAGLARLEATIALRALFERFPDLRGAGPRIRRDLRVLRGYEHIPVRA